MCRKHIENIFVKPKLKILSGRKNLRNPSCKKTSNAFKIRVKWQKNKTVLTIITHTT